MSEDRKLIRRMREERGLTRYEIDRLCGFPLGTMHRFETLTSEFSDGDYVRSDLILDAMRTARRADYGWMLQWRTERGWSIAKAAAYAAINWRTWKMLERGKNARQPSMAVRNRVATLHKRWLLRQQAAEDLRVSAIREEMSRLSA